MTLNSKILRRLLIVGGGVMLVCFTSVSANSMGERMRQNYVEFTQADIDENNPLPFVLESINNASDSSASIRYFLESVSLETFRSRLEQPSEWCEFIPLHLNIKACSYQIRNDKHILSFYVGIKGYLTPDKAHLLQLEFESNSQDGVFIVKLFAEDGPLDSSNINFDIRAISVEGDVRTGIYLEFDLSSIPGLAANLARIYLATVARNKIGFSIEGKTWSGKPKFVRGQRGATERNLVRYLLAIETYFATLDIPTESQFEDRLERWFDATERYRPQLYELERSEYISNKIRERKNQEILQFAIQENVQPIYVQVDQRK
ncbi:MAG: hypothetical protein ACR2QW_11440 [bacterium]